MKLDIAVTIALTIHATTCSQAQAPPPDAAGAGVGHGVERRTED